IWSAAAIACLLFLLTPGESLAQGTQSQRLTDLGNQRYQAGDVDGAIAAYQQAVSVNSIDSLAYANLGLALIDKGNLPEAAIALERAINLIDANDAAHPTRAPSRPMAYSLLAAAATN